MKKIFSLILVIISLTFSNVDAQINQKIISIHETKNCKIVHIDDWDTVSLLCKDNNKQSYIPHVRLLWVNAPDVWVSSNNHCYYEEAKNKINTYKNKDLSVTFYWSDICKDPYKGCRNLATLRDIETDTEINKLLIQEGYYFSWLNFSMIPKNIKVQYLMAEIKAKKNEKWLWNSCSINYQKVSSLDSSITPKMTKIKSL